MDYRRPVLGFVAVLTIVALLTGCTTNQMTSASGTEQSGTDSASSSSSSAASASADTGAGTGTDTSSSTPTANPAAGGGDYRIAARDVLNISVFQVPDLNKSVQVSQDGSITLPLLGKVSVGGMTTQEAEHLIADRLRKSYLQSPQVSISLQQYGQRVTVNGEVKNPRVLAIDGKVTLGEAIANAGGLTDLANSQRIHVARHTGGGHVEDAIYDLDAIQAGKTPDPTLKGGDIVVAEQSGTKLAIKNVKDMLPFAIFANLF